MDTSDTPLHSAVATGRVYVDLWRNSIYRSGGTIPIGQPVWHVLSNG